MLKVYSEFILDCLDPVVTRWVHGAQLLEDIARCLAAEVADRGGLTEGVLRYADSCAIPGSEPEDYALREVVLESGVVLLAGIHYYGLDLERPYVGVRAQSRAMSHGEALAAVEELSDEFDIFRPKCIRFRSPQGHTDLDEIPGTQPDLRIYAGHLGELVHLTPPKNYERIRLFHTNPDELYEEYCEIYEEFHAANPALNDRVARESLDSLNACRAVGGCFRVVIDDESAGLVAARPETTEGLDGWVVIEEILAAPFRGRGFGPATQRHLIDELDHRLSPLITGTIDSTNIASLKTAARTGRRDIGGWSFLPTRWR